MERIHSDESHDFCTLNYFLIWLSTAEWYICMRDIYLRSFVFNIWRFIFNCEDFVAALTYLLVASYMFYKSSIIYLLLCCKGTTVALIWILVAMQGPLSSTFPIENRITHVTLKALKNHLDRTKSLPFVKRISDFHLLLLLARFLDLNADVPALAECVQRQTAVPEGYQLLIESLASSWSCLFALLRTVISFHLGCLRQCIYAWFD